MYGLMGTLAARIHVLRAAMLNDRGETGPLGYAILVSAVVLLAIAVAAWGEGIAERYMSDVSDAGGDGDGGGGQ